MSEDYQGPSPEATNERMVFLVPSSCNVKIKYRVDLLANGGGGWCQCFDHATRRQPALDRGADPFTRAGHCRHVRAAREFFLRDLLKRMAREEDNP